MMMMEVLVLTWFGVSAVSAVVFHQIQIRIFGLSNSLIKKLMK